MSHRAIQANTYFFRKTLGTHYNPLLLLIHTLALLAFALPTASFTALYFNAKVHQMAQSATDDQKRVMLEVLKDP